MDGPGKALKVKAGKAVIIPFPRQQVSDSPYGYSILDVTNRFCPVCKGDYLNLIRHGGIKLYMCPHCGKQYRYK